MTYASETIPPAEKPPAAPPSRGVVASLLLIAAIVFVAEFAVMSVLPLLGLDGIRGEVVDSLLLVILTAPALYALGVRGPRRWKRQDLRRLTRLEKRTLALLGVQVAVVAAVVVAYAFLVSGEHAGARVVNLAGRQRMLAHKLVSEAVLEAADSTQGNEEGRDVGNPRATAATIARFEQVHRGLLAGDAELRLPTCASDEAARQLATVGEAWQQLRATVRVTR